MVATTIRWEDDPGHAYKTLNDLCGLNQNGPPPRFGPSSAYPIESPRSRDRNLPWRVPRGTCESTPQKFSKEVQHVTRERIF